VSKSGVKKIVRKPAAWCWRVTLLNGVRPSRHVNVVITTRRRTFVLPVLKERPRSTTKNVLHALISLPGNTKVTISASAALLDKKRKRGLWKANLQNPCAEDAIKDLITKNTGRSLENLSDAGEWQTLVTAIQQHPDLVTTIGAMATKETKNKEPKLSGLTTSTESTQPSASSSKSSLPQPNQSLSVSCETNEDSPRFRVGIGGEVRLARHSPSSTFLDEYDVFMRRADMIIASQANAIMDILGGHKKNKGKL
jgi:hypothetical protein